MLTTTVSRLSCPAWQEEGPCGGILSLEALRSESPREVSRGWLRCEACGAEYPILGGVAILVEDLSSYVRAHIKGIARHVPQAEVPDEILEDYLEARQELEEAPEQDVVEWDLEAERVVAVYFMNHYLKASEVLAAAPLPATLAELVREHWDHGPMDQVAAWVAELSREQAIGDCLELGCGVGGLGARLAGSCGFYLGLDTSFASVALGRHLLLGAPYAGGLAIPGDLLEEPRAIGPRPPVLGPASVSADLVVGDLGSVPVRRGAWDLVPALNVIDMLEEPERLPELQAELLAAGGSAIQSSPYVWHERVAGRLRSLRPPGPGIGTSAGTAQWLYERAGLGIRQALDHVPWLFYKHARQLEIYSAHLFHARREAG